MRKAVEIVSLRNAKCPKKPTNPARQVQYKFIRRTKPGGQPEILLALLSFRPPKVSVNATVTNEFISLATGLSVGVGSRDAADKPTRYHGVFAPNSPWRGTITPGGRGKGAQHQALDEVEEDTPAARRAAMTCTRRA